MIDIDSINAVAGIDTISVCWADRDLAKVLHLHSSLREARGGPQRLGPATVKRGQMGASLAVHRDVILGAYRSSPDMVFIEGRLAKLLHSDADASSLASWGDLAALPLGIARHLRELGVSKADDDLPFGPGVELAPLEPVDIDSLRLRRVDLAVDLRLGESGCDLLEIASKSRVPGRASAEWRNAGRVSLSISTERSKAILARIYDRAHATGEPVGHTVRLERQKRWSGDRRPALTELVEGLDPESAWRDEFEAWLPLSAQAAGCDIGVERIYSAQREGTITASVAERLIGTLDAIGRGERLWSAEGDRRRRQKLARLGIVAGQSSDRVVDFPAIRSAVSRAWTGALDARLTREDVAA